MAEYSAPFDGSTIATQVQWSRMARYWGVDGIHATTPTSGACKVTASGTATVSVGAGRAYVQGYHYHNLSAKTVSVPANAGGTARVDLVVLKLDPLSANNITAVYKTGGTTAPSLQQDDEGIWEIPLAQVTVPAGSSTVPSGNVIDLRWFTDRGAVPSISTARRPSSPGQLLVEGTSLYVGDGTTWNYLATGGVPDSTYTPVWSAGTTTINWGAGSQSLGRYQAVGRRVDVTIQLTPTGNPPEYPDPIGVSLPPGLPATANHRSLFIWNYTSNNGEGSAVGIGMVFPTEDQTKIGRLRYPATSGVSVSSDVNSINLLNNQPFNIRTGDTLTVDGSYWLA